jgi:hypothetical protein
VTANAVAIGGTYAYLGTNVGITVVDIADPAAPVIVAQMDLPTNVSSLGAFGDRLLASGNEVVLFDVRDPARPRREGGLTLPAGAPVALDGTYAYGGDGDSVKVFALDASGPADAPVAEIRLAAQPQAIVRDPTSDLLAVAAGAAGLYTLRLRSAPVVPTPTESATPPETRTPDPTPSATATEARPHRVWLPWAASPGPGRVGQALPVAAMRPRRSRGREPAAIRPARRRSRA